MKNLVSVNVILNVTYKPNSCLNTTFLIILWSVVAAIGYVLIGNGLYDEAIKHFSLLLQVRMRLLKHVFTLSASIRIVALCSAQECSGTLCVWCRVTQSWSVPCMGEGSLMGRKVYRWVIDVEYNSTFGVSQNKFSFGCFHISPFPEIPLGISCCPGCCVHKKKIKKNTDEQVIFKKITVRNRKQITINKNKILIKYIQYV